ncbi:glycosyltransferase family 2 protein [Streptomyces sp. NPDC004267]|uniref:glycosyltransferase family 2 protein n=1 Tax=Streptomyces sp. NPDC004267 TaxID=3364694 RepID=UPI0036AA937A
MTTPSTPTVSVVIPVYNAMPYLEQTLASVERQSIGTDAIEIVAVDDGSTDGGGEFLDAWAARYAGAMTVVHQEASGGPSRPRNVGLDHATGTYVFFLDGDDCLGPRALERLVAMAEKNGADTVLAKLVGAGRTISPTARDVFAKNVDRADPAVVYWTLMPFKLFRRAMLEEHGLRFPEHMRISEDQHFVARAYLHSGVISVVGDYDCYYLVGRGDQGNITHGGLDYATMVAQADELVGIVEELTEPGDLRDRLITRHVKVELLRRFGRRFLDDSDTDRKAVAELARPYAERWVTPGVLARLDVAERLRVHCIKEGLLDELAAVVEWDVAGRPGKTVVRDGRLYAAAPYTGVPELCDVTDAALGASPRRRVEELTWEGTVVELAGYAYLDQVDTDALTIETVLRHRDSGRETVLPVTAEATPHLTVSRGRETYDFGRAGFRIRLDLTDVRTLSEGAWDISLRCSAHGLTAEGRLGGPLAADIPRRVERRTLALGPEGSRPYDVSLGPEGAQLTLRLKQQPAPPAPPSTLTRVKRKLRRLARRAR